MRLDRVVPWHGNGFGVGLFFVNWRESVGETELALVSLKSLLGLLPSLRGCASDMVGVNKIAEAVTVPRLGKCQPIWPVSLKTSAGKPRWSGCNVARQREGAGLSQRGVSASMGGAESFIFYIL